MDVFWTIVGAAWFSITGFMLGCQAGKQDAEYKYETQKQLSKQLADEQNRSIYDMGVKYGRTEAFAEARDLLKDKN